MKEAALQVSLLGPLTVLHDGAPLDLPGRKTQALFAYLCCRAGAPVPRETLCGLFWGERGDDQARTSLRQTLATLRRALGPAAAALDTTGDALRIDPAAAPTDLATVMAITRNATIDDLRDAATLGGELLEGLGPVEPEFDRWLSGERAAVRARQVAILDRLSDLHFAAGEIDDVLACDARLLALDPLQERVHRRSMRALAAQQRYDAALRQFAAAEQVLSAELGLRPDPETLALAQEIRNRRRSGAPADAPQPQPTAAPALPSRPSLAVLPFKVLSAAPEAAYFGEGVAEDLTIELARMPDLLVISRHSTARFGPDGADPRAIGRDLGVRFCLGGSVRTLDGRARIAAHLLRCDDGSEVWADRFDGNIADLFDIQADIARTVAATVAGRIVAADTERLKTDRPANLSAYHHVLRGMSVMAAHAYDDAIAAFDAAIAADPGYARPLGLGALCRVYRRWYFQVTTDFSDAIPLARRAIARDPGQAQAHCALAISHLMQADHATAGDHFSVALARNPSVDLLLSEYARYLLYIDRAEDGIRHIREAMRLNPFHPPVYWNIYGRCLHTLCRHAEALAMFRHVPEPTFWVNAYMAACHAELGESDRAAHHVAEVLRLYPAFDFDRFMAIFPYADPATMDRFRQSFVRAGLDCR